VHGGCAFSYLRVLDPDLLVAIYIWQLDAVRSSTHVLNKQVGSGAGIQNVFGQVDSDH